MESGTGLLCKPGMICAKCVSKNNHRARSRNTNVLDLVSMEYVIVFVSFHGSVDFRCAGFVWLIQSSSGVPTGRGVMFKR